MRKIFIVGPLALMFWGAVYATDVTMEDVPVDSEEMTDMMGEKDDKLGGLPLLFRVPGIGYGYGGVGIWQNAGGSRLDLLAGAISGDVATQFLLLRDIPLGEAVGLNFAVANINRFGIDQTYTRNLDDGPRYRQHFGDGFAANVGVKVRHSKHWSSNYSITHWSLKFLEFKNSNGDNLTAENRFLITMGYIYEVRFDFRDTERLLLPISGGLFNAGAKFINYRSQARQLVFDIGYSRYFELFKRIGLTVHGQFSRAEVVQTGHDDTPENTQRLSIRPGGLCTPSVGRDAECALLERRLTTFLAQTNTIGNAGSLGGINGARSYRQERFRAQNTALQVFEVNWNFTGNYYFTVFTDLARANDEIDRLFDKTLFSAGAGLRYAADKTLLRLEVAGGDAGTEFLLFAGLPW